jgi:hypothetical protein
MESLKKSSCDITEEELSKAILDMPDEKYVKISKITNEAIFSVKVQAGSCFDMTEEELKHLLDNSSI